MEEKQRSRERQITRSGLTSERACEDFIVPGGGSCAHLFPSPAKRFVRDVEQRGAKYAKRRGASHAV